MGSQFRKRFGRLLRNGDERSRERARVAEAFEENDVIDRQREKPVRFARKIREAILDGRVHNRLAIEPVRDRFVIPFEEVLIDAVVVVKQLERRFKPLREACERGLVQAFVIDTPHFHHNAEVSRLGEEHVGVDEAVEVHLFVERTCLFVVPENPFQLKHGGSCGPQSG